MKTIKKYEFVREEIERYKYDNTKINSSDKVAEILNNAVNVGKYTIEKFYTFMLNTKLELIGFSEISSGNLDSAPVHPREVFTSAIKTPGCAAVIIAHNHPSGDCKPSQPDIEVTERLKAASDILGIKLIDHVIVSGKNYTSLKSDGYM